MNTSSGDFGFSNNDVPFLIAAREKVYTELFGDTIAVSHELQLLKPHIDVYVCEPGFDGRKFWTFVTSGMSDFSMNAPPEVGCRRAELVMYGLHRNEEAVNLLRWLAHLIHDKQTWMSPGSTMSNGQPPQPIFANSQLDHFLFLDSIVQPDAFLPDKLSLEGERVNLLWVVPITAKECEFVRTRGLDEFLDLLERNRHPHVLDINRRSYV